MQMYWLIASNSHNEKLMFVCVSLSLSIQQSSVVFFFIRNRVGVHHFYTIEWPFQTQLLELGTLPDTSLIDQNEIANLFGLALKQTKIKKKIKQKFI